MTWLTLFSFDLCAGSFFRNKKFMPVADFSYEFMAKPSGYPCKVKYNQTEQLWEAFVTLPWDHPDLEYYTENSHIPWMVDDQEVIYQHGTTVGFKTDHYIGIPGFFTIISHCQTFALNLWDSYKQYIKEKYKLCHGQYKNKRKARRVKLRCFKPYYGPDS